MTEKIGVSFPRFLAVLLIATAAGTFFFMLPFYHSQTKTITIYGNIDVRKIDLSFRIPGRIAKLYVEEGQEVKAGDLIAELEESTYKDLLCKAKAKRDSAKLFSQNASNALERREELVDIGGISEEELDRFSLEKGAAQLNLIQAEAAYQETLKNWEDLKCYAPSDGIILSRVREPGQVVLPANPVCTLTLSKPTWVRAYVPETQLGFVAPGDEAEIFTDSRGIGPYKGKVGFISPMAEFTPKSVETSQLRTDLVYRLRILVDTPDRGLRQGMPVTVVLKRG